MGKTGKYILGGGVALAILALGYFFLQGASDFGPGLSDFEYKIASSCTLSRYSAYVVVIDCEGINTRIDAEVVQVGWNNDYLVAITHPVTKRKYPNIPDNTYSEPDESISYWWIRDLKNKKAYGPMSESEFNQKELDLKMPDIPLMSIDDAKAKGTLVTGD